VVWDCAQPEDVVAVLPPRRLVIKRGRVTIEAHYEVRQRWREPHGAVLSSERSGHRTMR
jgi:hypothetical protein